MRCAETPRAARRWGPSLRWARLSLHSVRDPVVARSFALFPGAAGARHDTAGERFGGLDLRKASIRVGCEVRQGRLIGGGVRGYLTTALRATQRRLMPLPPRRREPLLARAVGLVH